MRSIHVATALKWESSDELYKWLEEEQWLRSGQSKPDRPKEAMRTALRKAKKPWSSAIYLEISKNASFKRCADPTFMQLISTLQSWFPRE